MSNTAILEVRHMVTQFRGVVPGTSIRAVDDVSLHVSAGEIVGLVGESGCGKSSLSRSIVGLEKPRDGSVILDGVDLGQLRGVRLREARRAVQYVFQDPYSSLGDRQTIGEAIEEAIVIGGHGSDASRRIADLLDKVGLPASFAARYPRELSGGQRQRVAIARALAVEPRVLICDEPVSALDLSIRAQVMNLFFALQKDLGVACVLVAHDLPLVRQAASRVYVMYLGQIVEEGTSADIYERPSHPYTRALLASAPSPDPTIQRHRAAPPLTGDIPSPTNPPSGCRFRTRCPMADQSCASLETALQPLGGVHKSRCQYAGRLHEEAAAA